VAAFRDVVCHFHEIVDCVVDGFDTVGVIDSELRVVWCLDLLVDDWGVSQKTITTSRTLTAVDYSKCIHVELNTLHRSVLNRFILLVEVVVETGSVVSAVTNSVSLSFQTFLSGVLPLSPKIERVVCDIRVKLRGEIQESLQDVPGTDGCSIGGVRSVWINKRVSAICIFESGLIREADAHRLAKEQHVALLVPGVGVPLRLEIFGDVAGSQLLEQPNHRITSRTSVQPQCQRLLLGVLASLEEPEEHVRLLIEADVSGIVVDAFFGFANALLARLLVSDLSALGRGDSGDTCGVCWDLALNN
jgi:hypothetical protein